MQPAEQTDDTERTLRAALAAAQGVPEDDGAITDFVRIFLWMVEGRRWGGLPLEFQDGLLVQVGGIKHRFDRRWNRR